MAFVVTTEIDRASAEIVAALGKFDVATVHEAQGRAGLMASYLRPIYRPASMCGTAVTRKWRREMIG